MVISLTVWIVRPFITRPMFYNSHEAAFLFAPLNTDDPAWVRDFFQYEQLQTVHLLQRLSHVVAGPLFWCPNAIFPDPALDQDRHPLLSCLFVRYRTSSALGALWVAFLTLATQGLLRTLSTFRYATWPYDRKRASCTFYQLSAPHQTSAE